MEDMSASDARIHSASSQHEEEENDEDEDRIPDAPSSDSAVLFAGTTSPDFEIMNQNDAIEYPISDNTLSFPDDASASSLDAIDSWSSDENPGAESRHHVTRVTDEEDLLPAAGRHYRPSESGRYGFFQ